MVNRPLTTVVDHGQPVDARTKQPYIIKQPTTPFTRQRLNNPTPDELARQLHEMQSTVHDVTQGIRQMPEGGPRTYLKDVSFVSGVAKTLNHLMGVAPPPSGAAPGGQYTRAADAIAASPSQIRFSLINHRVAFGGCYRSAVTERTITLVPSATFTADVVLFVLA